ncbi:CDP-alcohol phosphatidyltransferase family protein [Herbiconiux sp. P18]|uniref:CDP-alcohol phosphatidyltransferase family protein n=1 Tax=Herbiconiux liangxiaofengii TaxID=3342795 RepID=UPI0035BABFD7
MNLPNAISLGRLLMLTPLFVVSVLAWRQPAAALALLVVLGITDWLDGFIARRFDLVTELGKRLDPLADRVSQVVVCVTLVLAGFVPLWMAIVLIVGDLVLGAAILIARPQVVRVSRLGRLRTVLLMAGFPLLLLIEWLAPGDPVAQTIALVVVGVGVVLHGLANVQYAWVTLREGRAGAPTVPAQRG